MASQDWLKALIYDRPASLVNHVRQVHLLLISTQTYPTIETWLPHLQAIEALPWVVQVRFP